MQIYNHFICRCLPRTACRNIAQHHASKMSSLTQAASLASSQSPGFTHLSWMEINVAEGPAGCILSQRACMHVCAVLVYILQKVIPARWTPCWRNLCFSGLTWTALPFVWWWAFRVQGAACVLPRRAPTAPHLPNVVVHHPPGWRDGEEKAKGKERSQFFTLSAQRGNVVPL